jgi:hypothetical protein
MPNGYEFVRFLPHVYAAYAAATIGLTIWLARTLGRSGAVYLSDVFPDRPDLAAAVNRLLVVGFYLVNLGYGCMTLAGGTATDVREAIETLSGKLGSLLVALAVMHFVNMIVFHRIRRRALLKHSPPPLAPHAFAPVAPSEVATIS